MSPGVVVTKFDPAYLSPRPDWPYAFETHQERSKPDFPRREVVNRVFSHGPLLF